LRIAHREGQPERSVKARAPCWPLCRQEAVFGFASWAGVTAPVPTAGWLPKKSEACRSRRSPFVARIEGPKPQGADDEMHGAGEVEGRGGRVAQARPVPGGRGGDPPGLRDRRLRRERPDGPDPQAGRGAAQEDRLAAEAAIEHFAFARGGRRWCDPPP